ncbi:hypothetical protein VST7929_01242 [Vibrio stylophorae]|uniref:Uncharacterized protein n=1 Tax=Vibrio stylophorae TaxID=659351 RepID=A0ABM8ZST8_9VIBR|nr:hypothetical protein [Vibrio stylophorae]CAH0533376.1 hypothetical protein VST7929_01242 [Vibrio stylophorae]
MTNHLDLVINILGWSSLVFYIGLLIFNQFKGVRIATFLSVVNDIIYGALLGILPKVLLNGLLGFLNFYRYAQDYMNVPKRVIHALAAIAVASLLGFAVYAIRDFSANPSWAIALNWMDFVLILVALSVTNMKIFQWAMFISAFVGGTSYFLLGAPQMVIICIVKGLLMAHKLFINPYFPSVEMRIKRLFGLRSTMPARPEQA